MPYICTYKKNSMDDKLKHLIEQNKGYITRKQIIGNRYLYYQLLESVKLGEIIRLKPGVYCIDDAMAETMIDLDKIVPEGVLCLYSSWAHYGLTTQIPQGFYVAIPRKRKLFYLTIPLSSLIIGTIPSIPLELSVNE